MMDHELSKLDDLEGLWVRRLGRCVTPSQVFSGHRIRHSRHERGTNNGSMQPQSGDRPGKPVPTWLFQDVPILFQYMWQLRPFTSLE